MKFIVLVRLKESGTLHAAISNQPRKGALVEYDDMEQALAAVNTIPACATNPYFILPIEG